MVKKSVKLENTDDGIYDTQEEYDAAGARNAARVAKLREEKNKKYDYSGGWWDDVVDFFGRNVQVAKNPEGTWTLQVIPFGDQEGDKRFIAGEDFEFVPKRFIKPTPIPEPILTPAEQEKKEIDEATEAGNALDIANIENNYQWRRIAGFAPIDGRAPTKIEINQLDETPFLRDDGSGNYRYDSTRFKYVNNPRAPRGQPSSYAILYKGSSLTDENNRLARKKYDSENVSGVDVRNELMKLNRKSGLTLVLMKELKRTGFYGEREISNIALNNQGFGPNEELAMAALLNFSNQKLQTWQAIIPQLARMSTIGYSKGPQFRPDSEAEMMAYANEISLALTGQKMTKAKLKQAIENTVSMQRNAFAGGTDAPPSATILQEQIPKLSSAQAASYGLGTAMKLAFDALGA